MASFGENLRRERELRGITLHELANATKVSPAHLQALERNQFHRLPGGIYNRGFVRAVARYMKLDESFWAAEYARAAGEEPEIAARYEAPEPRPAASSHRGMWSFAALVVVFAVGAYVVHDLRVRRAAEASAVETAGQPATTAPVPQPAALPPVQEAKESPKPAEPQAAPAREEPTRAAASASDLRLQVDVIEEAWVHVKVDDQTRYQGTMKPGTPLRFRGGRRLEVTTRNASAVVLTLNGETLPPLGHPGEEKTVVLTPQDLKPAPR